MKKVFLFLSICILFVSLSFAQKAKDTIKLTSLEVVSGKGAVTSGFYVYGTLENKKSSLMLTLSNNDNEITYLRKLFKNKVFAGINGGYFFNVPFAAPQVIWSPNKYISTLHWVGFCLGKPETVIKNSNTYFMFSVQQANFKIKNITLSYTLIHYLDNIPQNVGNIRYSGKINKNISIYTNIGYDFTKETQLLQLGGRYEF